MSASRFTDDRFHGGTVGLRAEGTKGTKNIIYFDNLEVRKINPEDFQPVEQEEVSDLIYRQDFSNETQDWTLDSSQGDWGTVNRSVSDGTYQWEINLSKNKAVVVRPNIEINLPENDYQISLDTYFELVCENCCSGILFNFLDMGNFYYAPLCTTVKSWFMLVKITNGFY